MSQAPTVTMIRSYGPWSGSPSCPSPVTTLTCSCPVASRGGSGFGGDVRGDVDRGDVSGGAGEVGKEGGVIAGASADFEDAVAGLDLEVVEHDGDEAGHGCAAERGSVGGPVGDDGFVGVGVFQTGLGNELVPSDATHGGFDLERGRSRGNNGVDHPGAQIVRRCVGGGVHSFLLAVGRLAGWRLSPWGVVRGSGCEQQTGIPGDVWRSADAVCDEVYAGPALQQAVTYRLFAEAELVAETVLQTEEVGGKVDSV